MKGTIRATVKYGAMPQKEKRFVKGTPKRIIQAWKIATKAKMIKRSPQPERTAGSGTLKRDAERYYPLIKHLADWVSRRSEIRAWFPELGERMRHTIDRQDIYRVRGQWCEAGIAVKTINNRISALRNLYRLLDGDAEPTPCDGVKPLPTVKEPITIIDDALVNAVLKRLQESTQKDAQKDAARLMVLAVTGKRPCELMRAEPGDVHLLRRVWIPRDAKGGFCPGIYLNDEMLAAWQIFAFANAWGEYSTTHFVRRLRRAGWPKGVRPYNLRHTTWITASERGIDLSDIQAGAGHRTIATTRRHYVPVLASRMQRMSEALMGRYGWQPSLAPHENNDKTH